MRKLLLHSYRHPKTVSGWMVGECGLTNITEGVTGGQFRCSLNMLGGMSSFILIFLKKEKKKKVTLNEIRSHFASHWEPYSTAVKSSCRTITKILRRRGFKGSTNLRELHSLCCPTGITVEDQLKVITMFLHMCNAEITNDYF